VVHWSLFVRGASGNAVPHYVDDPVNPGKKIDVHALQERDPLRDLEPIFIGRYLRDDLWTLREALQILAGYDPV
jgi:hypothetical protein